MANIVHLRCRYCGEPLDNKEWPYCPPCNLYLCYRAMPILLGMLFPLEQQKNPTQRSRTDLPLPMTAGGADEEPCIMVAYPATATTASAPSAYEDEPCIMVAY